MSPRPTATLVALLASSLAPLAPVASQDIPERAHPSVIAVGVQSHAAPAMPSAFGIATLPIEAPQVASGPNRGRGALIGGGIGLVVGGVLGALSVQDADINDEFGDASLAEGVATGVAVVGGGLLGLAAGAVLGATVFAPSSPVGGTSSSRVAWRPTVSVDPASGAWRTGLSLQRR